MTEIRIKRGAYSSRPRERAAFWVGGREVLDGSNIGRAAGVGDSDINTCADARRTLHHVEILRQGRSPHRIRVEVVGRPVYDLPEHVRKNREWWDNLARD